MKTISQLINMDACQAIDWLIENRHKFEIVPVELNEGICKAFHEADDIVEEGFYESPDHQWEAMLTEIRRQAYE